MLVSSSCVFMVGTIGDVSLYAVAFFGRLRNFDGSADDFARGDVCKLG